MQDERKKSKSKVTKKNRKKVYDDGSNILYMQRIGNLQQFDRKNIRKTHDGTGRDIAAYILKNKKLSSIEVHKRLGIEPIYSDKEMQDIAVMKKCYNSLPAELKTKIPTTSLHAAVAHMDSVYNTLFGTGNYEIGRLPVEDGYEYYGDQGDKNYIFQYNVTQGFGYQCLAINQIEGHSKSIRMILKEAFQILIKHLKFDVAKDTLFHQEWESNVEDYDYLRQIVDDEESMSSENLKKLGEEVSVIIERDNERIEEFIHCSKLPTKFKRIEKYILKNQNDLSKWLFDILHLFNKEFNAYDASFFCEDCICTFKDTSVIVYNANGLYNQMIEKSFEGWVNSGYSETGIYTHGYITSESFKPYDSEPYYNIVKRIFSFNLNTLKYA